MSGRQPGPHKNCLGALAAGYAGEKRPSGRQAYVLDAGEIEGVEAIGQEEIKNAHTADDGRSPTSRRRAGERLRDAEIGGIPPPGIGMFFDAARSMSEDEAEAELLAELGEQGAQSSR